MTKTKWKDNKTLRAIVFIGLPIIIPGGLLFMGLVLILKSLWDIAGGTLDYVQLEKEKDEKSTEEE